MSSESRNELLEALLAAKYDLEICEDSEKAECQKALEACIHTILERHPKISRYDLLEAVRFKYQEYRVAHLKAQRRRETL